MAEGIAGILCGIFVIAGGLFADGVASSSMPPVRKKYPMPKRIRVILIGFGIVFVIYGIDALSRR
jgi:threonine/homoserine/homoserine lactone efflux protein